MRGFNLTLRRVAGLLGHFWRVKIGGSSGCDVCAFLELGCFDFFLFVSIAEPAWLIASLKSSQWDDCLHPGVVIKVFGEKTLFEVVDCLIGGILLMSLLLVMLVYKEMIFLALILELVSDMRFVVFVLVPGWWLQWEFPFKPVWWLFALSNFLLIK